MCRCAVSAGEMCAVIFFFVPQSQYFQLLGLCLNAFGVQVLSVTMSAVCYGVTRLQRSESGLSSVWKPCTLSKTTRTPPLVAGTMITVKSSDRLKDPYHVSIDGSKDF